MGLCAMKAVHSGAHAIRSPVPVCLHKLCVLLLHACTPCPCAPVHPGVHVPRLPVPVRARPLPGLQRGTVGAGAAARGRSVLQHRCLEGELPGQGVGWPAQLPCTHVCGGLHTRVDLWEQGLPTTGRFALHIDALKVRVGNRGYGAGDGMVLTDFA